MRNFCILYTHFFFLSISAFTIFGSSFKVLVVIMHKFVYYTRIMQMNGGNFAFFIIKLITV